MRTRALVLPSFAEGLPVVLMEALALHRPVVSTYVAGIPELVEDGGNGWLVPAGSVDALAAALFRVLEAAPERLAEMGRAGAARVAAAHNASREAAKLAALFRKVHGAAPVPRRAAVPVGEATRPECVPRVPAKLGGHSWRR
jgi:glycosyltransferase involved in cell wall biosynthesis